MPIRHAFILLAVAGVPAHASAPKFARMSDVALALKCQVADVARRALADGYDVRKVTGKLNIKKSVKNSRALGIAAVIPFEVFEFGPALSYTREGSYTSGVSYDLDLDPKAPVPPECERVAAIRTFGENGRDSGAARIAPLRQLQDIYRVSPGNAMTPSSYAQEGTFTTEVSRSGGLTINFLFFKLTSTVAASTVTKQSGYAVDMAVTPRDPFHRPPRR